MTLPTDPTRRQALQALGALAALSATGCNTTEEQLPKATPVDPKTVIKTWVILMMENRSFDHYFGSLSLEEDRSDVDGLKAEHVNLDAAGNEIHPWWLPFGCMDDPPHGWSSSHAQFADGANSGFVLAHHAGADERSPEVMGYYRRADLPFYHALADGSALCQRWFASVMGPTWPNRFYSLCGTSEGHDDNDLAYAPLRAPSIFRQLDEAGVSWRIYVTEFPFAALIADVSPHVTGGDKVRHIEQFYADAAAGTLPTVCFVDPGFTFNDDHPPHAIALGQVFVGTIYQALADSPQWEGSALIIDYDEHGGFFDHVPPPRTDDDHAAQGFDQLGFRIPALVVGPYARTAVVDTVFDHTSVLKTLQEVWGIPPLTARNAAANPLWDCFDLDRMALLQPEPPITLPTMVVNEEELRAACSTSFAAPGQPEMNQAADIGLIPPEWDFRSRIDETMARMLVRAERQGLLKVRTHGL